MKNLAPRTARLAGAGAAAFVLVLAAPAMASADVSTQAVPECDTTNLQWPVATADVNVECRDLDGDDLTIVEVTRLSGLGSAAIVGDTVVITGIPDTETGVAEFQALVSDGDENEEPSVWPINLRYKAEEPDDPNANPDSFSVKAGATKTGNVRDNDGSEDSPAGDWDVVLDAKPGKGSLTLNANGSFTYKANAGTSGKDTFTYHLVKGDKKTNVATVSISITATGGGGGDDGDDDDNNNGGGDNTGDNNNGDDTAAKNDKDKLAKTGMSLTSVAVTGAGALGAGAVALWFSRRRKETGEI
ncbi:Ig-like domain-containing protein [Phytomonospora sp. NPDC050363]|uniref:Ig-like domain-containing protein n=1 Tax=Phytomonospora sp. NPDC050363 TaxID=3155642 RepID=UPI0033D6408D